MTLKTIHLGDETYAEILANKDAIELYNAYDSNHTRITLTRPMLLKLLEAVCPRPPDAVLIKPYLTLPQNKPQIDFISDEPSKSR